MLKSNWSENDINQAFESIKKGIPVPPSQEIPVSANHQTKTILVVVALLAFYPVGLVLMWMWMREWPKWVKLLLSAPIILMILAILGIIFTFILVAQNPRNIKNLQPVSTRIIYPTRAVSLPTSTYTAPSLIPTSSASPTFLPAR